MLAACVLCFSACLSVVYCSYEVIIFLRAEEHMEREKKINEERNRRASIFFLPINPLKMVKINTSRFVVSKRLGDRINLKYTRSG